MSKSNYHTGRKRDNCYFCHARGTEEHHIIPQRFDGPDDSTNIVGVCSHCHTKLERLYDKSFYEWFGIDDEKGERLFHRSCAHSDCKNTVTRVMRRKPGYEGIKLCEKHGREFAERCIDSNDNLRSVKDEPTDARIDRKMKEMTVEKSSEVSDE